MMTLGEVHAATYLTWVEGNGERVHAKLVDGVFTWRGSGGFDWYASGTDLYHAQGKTLTDLQEGSHEDSLDS